VTIDTRVGHIGDHDNQFMGRSVFDRLAGEMRSAGDAVAVALGLTPDDDDREALRLVALCTTSPDARVWPLKLCRLLASWGSPMVGTFASQLVSASHVMGPGTATGCALALRAVAEAVGEDPDPARIVAVLERWRADHGGRIGGFGVPFRPEDERLVALRRLVRGTALERRPFWRLQERVAAAMATRDPVQPNVVLGVSALLLDAGVHPRHCGLALALSMHHMFAAHAMEAAVTDRALRDLPAEVVEYRGAPPRSTADPGLRPPVHPALQRRGPRATDSTTAYGRAGGSK
jgi:hypothetical protein